MFVCLLLGNAPHHLFSSAIAKLRLGHLPRIPLVAPRDATSKALHDSFSTRRRRYALVIGLLPPAPMHEISGRSGHPPCLCPAKTPPIHLITPSTPLLANLHFSQLCIESTGISDIIQLPDAEPTPTIAACIWLVLVTSKNMVCLGRPLQRQHVLESWRTASLGLVTTMIEEAGSHWFAINKPALPNQLEVSWHQLQGEQRLIFPERGTE